MPNDAKLGMLVGLGLVIATAVMYFEQPKPVDATATSQEKSLDPASARPSAPAMLAPAGSVHPASVAPQVQETNLSSRAVGLSRPTTPP